jgi:hypothetical protein
MEIICFDNILLCLRRSQNHHRDSFQAGNRFHFGQDLPSVFAGQVEIEQNQIGLGSVFIRMFMLEKEPISKRPTLANLCVMLKF